MSFGDIFNPFDPIEFMIFEEVTKEIGSNEHDECVDEYDDDIL